MDWSRSSGPGVTPTATSRWRARCPKRHRRGSPVFRAPATIFCRNGYGSDARGARLAAARAWLRSPAHRHYHASPSWTAPTLQQDLDVVLTAASPRLDFSRSSGSISRGRNSAYRSAVSSCLDWKARGPRPVEDTHPGRERARRWKSDERDRLRRAHHLSRGAGGGTGLHLSGAGPTRRRVPRRAGPSAAGHRIDRWGVPRCARGLAPGTALGACAGRTRVRCGQHGCPARRRAGAVRHARGRTHLFGVRDGPWPGFDEPFEDDDEVAVVHAPAEAGGRALSDAMVDLRDTLAAAETAGVIDRSTRDILVGYDEGAAFRRTEACRV